MIESALFRAARSRRQLLQTFAALALMPPAAMVAAPQVLARRRPKRPKFRLVTFRFTIRIDNVPGSGSTSARVAEATDLPQGTVAAIAVTLSDLNTADAGWLNALVGSGQRPDGVGATWGLVISDAGNGEGATGEDITISSRATKAPPRTGRLVSGSYRATNYDGEDYDDSRNSVDGFKLFLGKSAQQNWFVEINNDGPNGVPLNVGGITLTLTVKVRR